MVELTTFCTIRHSYHLLVNTRKSSHRAFTSIRYSVAPTNRIIFLQAIKDTFTYGSAIFWFTLSVVSTYKTFARINYPFFCKKDKMIIEGTWR